MDDLVPQDVLEMFRQVLPTVGLLGLLLLALLLLLLGRSLVRFAVGASGFVLGALAGWVAGQVLAEQGAVTIALVIGCGIIGLLLAALLFRFWMALSAAAIFALAFPAAVLLWQGVPEETPELEPAVTEQEADPDEADEPTPTERELAAILLERFGLEELEEMVQGGEIEPNDIDRQFFEDVELEQVVETAAEMARDWYERQLDRVAGWWDAQDTSNRQLLAFGALIGAGLGLVLGLLLPYIAASVESALAGAILLFFAARELASLHAPALLDYSPQGPRGTLLLILLFTLLGFSIQWAIFRRRKAG